MVQTDKQMDDILWHHCMVKLGRPNVANIIGITDILSQKYRYIVDLKNRHGPLLGLYTPTHTLYKLNKT